jgi:hypothetical protein
MRERPTLVGVVVGMAVLAAVLLVASLFVNWFELSSATGEVSVKLSGWDALETTDSLLLILALVTVYFLIVRRFGLLVPLGLATIAVVVVVIATDTPTIALADSAGSGAQAAHEIGMYIALAGAVLLLASGAVAITTRPTGS